VGFLVEAVLGGSWTSDQRTHTFSLSGLYPSKGHAEHDEQGEPAADLHLVVTI
jgi:hypothetical protein